MSGIPRCSLSIVISDRLNSLCFFCSKFCNFYIKNLLVFSNFMTKELGSSSALRVIESSLPPHFMILLRLATETPRVICLSQRYSSNPSEERFRVTRATWELSMAWREIPVEVMSRLMSVTRSFILSISFLRRMPSESFA